MQKAAEELKKQQEKESEEKKKAVDARVPKLGIEGLDKSKMKFIFSFLTIIDKCGERPACFEPASLLASGHMPITAVYHC